jgi:hypothetical protein
MVGPAAPCWPELDVRRRRRCRHMEGGGDGARQASREASAGATARDAGRTTACDAASAERRGGGGARRGEGAAARVAWTMGRGGRTHETNRSERVREREERPHGRDRGRRRVAAKPVEKEGERLGFERGGKYIYEWLWTGSVLNRASLLVVSCRADTSC